MLINTVQSQHEKDQTQQQTSKHTDPKPTQQENCSPQTSTSHTHKFHTYIRDQTAVNGIRFSGTPQILLLASTLLSRFPTQSRDSLHNS